MSSIVHVHVYTLQFEPSEEAIEVISTLLDATTPFFINDDPLDTEPLYTTNTKGWDNNHMQYCHFCCNLSTRSYEHPGRYYINNSYS